MGTSSFMQRPPRAEEYKDFMDWYCAQPHKHKVLISGNRDNFMDTNTSKKHDLQSGFWRQQVQEYVKEGIGVTYLEDQMHEINIGEAEEDSKIRIYGTPWTGLYGKPGKAFQIPRTELSAKWSKIPANVDILISHMPPHGVLDTNAGGVKAGCQDLLRTVVERIRPRIHVFGHIHESAGVTSQHKILFINAASKIPRSKNLNKPIVVDYFVNSSHVKIIE